MTFNNLNQSNQFMNFNYGLYNNNNSFCMNNINHMNFMNNNINNANNMDNMNLMNNINNWNDLNMNNQNQTNSKYFNVEFNCKGKRISIQTSSDERVCDLIKKFKNKAYIYDGKITLFFYGRKIDYNSELTLEQEGIKKMDKPPVIEVIFTSEIIGAGGFHYDKEINIKFLKLPSSVIYENNNKDIKGILKLCLLKEVSQKLTDDKLKLLPDIFNYIMKILQKGYIIENDNI